MRHENDHDCQPTVAFDICYCYIYLSNHPAECSDRRMFPIRGIHQTGETCRTKRKLIPMESQALYSRRWATSQVAGRDNLWDITTTGNKCPESVGWPRLRQETTAAALIKIVRAGSLSWRQPLLHLELRPSLQGSPSRTSLWNG